MGKKKRLKAHVHRHMERRRRGGKKPRQKVVGVKKVAPKESVSSSEGKEKDRKD